MKEFLASIALLPGKLMNLIHGFIDGLVLQVSTAKGAIILFIVVILVADILVEGKLGAIKHAVQEGTGLLKAIFDILKEVGVSTLAVLAVAYAVYVSKKS